MTFYYEGIARLDWGLGNPNRTAALIACLMMGVWALAYVRRWGFWAAWATSTVLGILLVQTFSRGGFLAAAVGAALLIFFARRPWPRLSSCLIGLSVLALISYAVVLSAGERVATSWQGDPSVLNRLELWKNVPRMIADAPSGWGLNNAQQAYMQWYQGIDRPERFLNLVSLHFTLLAELPWPLRISYAIAWALAFLLTFPSRRSPELAVAFSVTVTFFAAGIFTHFAESWPVYLPLTAAVIGAIVLRLVRKEWPGLRVSLLTACAAPLVFLPLAFLDSPPIVIEGTPRHVTIGRGPPGTWILVSTEVLGGSYGKTLRAHPSPLPALGFATKLANIPPAHTLVLCGRVSLSALEELRRISPRRILLLNSDFFPGQIREFSGARIHAFFGEFAESNSLSTWQQSGALTLIPGSGTFVPEWPAILARELQDQ